MTTPASATPKMFPSVFVSHGAPTFATEPGRAGPMLRALAQSLPVPRAIVVASPHWITRSTQVSSAPRPETIYDFGGFPDDLYQLAYPAGGAPDVAERVAALLRDAGIAAGLDANRGLDHGTWVPLMHMYPDAGVPVLQVSLAPRQSPEYFVRFGRALAALRREGVLVLGSGSITHNLYDFRHGATTVAPYATAFIDWIAQRLAAGDLDALLNYRALAPFAERAHPTDEHLMPLFVALGAAGDDWKSLRRLDAGISDGVLGMDAYVFGAAATADAAAPERREAQAEAVS